MNDIAGQIKEVELLERSWPSIPKNQLTEGSRGGETYITFAWECGPVKVVVWAIVSPRGAITEQLLVVDSSVTRSVLDRLVMWRCVRGDGILLPLYDMKSRKKKEGLNPLEMCRTEMATLLKQILEDPERFVGILKDRALETGESVGAISGGLPSLGLNSR